MQKEYKILKEKYCANRKKAKDIMDHYLHSTAKPMLTQLKTQVDCKLGLDIKNKHPVNDLTQQGLSFNELPSKQNFYTYLSQGLNAITSGALKNL